MSPSERELSCFFCRELFSLYLGSHLDDARATQVERHLKGCSSCSALFKKVKESQNVILELAKTKPTPGLVEYLRREHHFWTDFFEQMGWQKWPAALKWSAELTALASVLAVTIHFFPWLNLVKTINRMRAAPSAQIAANGPQGKPLPETLDTDGIEKAVGDSQGNTSETFPGIAGLAPGEPPAGAPLKNNKALTPSVAVEKTKAQATATPGEDVTKNAAPSPAKETSVAENAPKKSFIGDQEEQIDSSGKNDQDEKDDQADEDEKSGSQAQAVAASSPAASSTQDSSDDADSPQTSAETESSDSQAPKETGWVWKGTLKVDDLTDDIAEKVTKIIEDLGGVKAGHVELGWHRGDDRYYHFILPEENYDKLLRDLNEVGIVELTKQRHPRVIKEGHMRIIMTMEESE